MHFIKKFKFKIIKNYFYHLNFKNSSYQILIILIGFLNKIFNLLIFKYILILVFKKNSIYDSEGRELILVVILND